MLQRFITFPEFAEILLYLGKTQIGYLKVLNYKLFWRMMELFLNEHNEFNKFTNLTNH